MKKETRIVNAGRDPRSNYGIVNPPVYHASTVIFPTVAALESSETSPFEGVRYGRYGTPTTQAFEAAVAVLEGGERCVSLPSGLAAIACALIAFVKAGDHVLVTDNVYGPTRGRLCDGLLRDFGVETTYYDPMIGAGIADLLRAETKVVFVEAPGSITFEVQDVGAIAAAAHAAGATVIMDNTWSGGLYFQPFEHGVDVSVHAATKYIVGHSDAMLGAVTTTASLYERVKSTAVRLGYAAGPDDCYLGLRGLRSIAARMPHHQDVGMHGSQRHRRVDQRFAFFDRASGHRHIDDIAPQSLTSQLEGRSCTRRCFEKKIDYGAANQHRAFLILPAVLFNIGVGEVEVGGNYICRQAFDGKKMTLDEFRRTGIGGSSRFRVLMLRRHPEPHFVHSRRRRRALFTQVKDEVRVVQGCATKPRRVHAFSG